MSEADDGDVCREAGTRDTHDCGGRALTAAVGTCAGPIQGEYRTNPMRCQHANCTQWVTRNKTEEGRHFRVSKGSRDHSAYDQDTLFTSMKLSKNK